MPSKIIIRQKRTDDNDAVAVLIRDSLNVWYKKNRGFDAVVPSVEAATIYSRVYDALDPGCCLVAEDVESGRLAGSCFYHPRPTHVSLGLMTVAPDYFGQSVSSKLLGAIVEIAKGRNQTLRLVSSAMNLDSFSLYNRAGFIPTAMYQDMQIKVPAEGFELSTPAGATLRDALESDVPAIVELERRLCGIDRAKDFKFFIENAQGIWGTSLLVDDATGAIRGVMCSVRDPGCNMVGPGVAIDEESAIALIARELNRYAGEWSPIVLVPTKAPTLRLQMYAFGGRNTETHVAQALGDATPNEGIVVPTFMPETA